MKRSGMISDKFVTQGNKIIFYFAIPTTIFNHIHRADLRAVFDIPFLIFNVGFLVSFFLIVWLLAYKFMKDKDSVASFVNSAYRSSLSVVGPPLLVLMFSVRYHPNIDPNILAKGILAVSILLIFSYATASVVFAVHDPKARKKGVLGVLVAIAKNPVVIGVVVGLVFNILGFRLTTVSNTPSFNVYGSLVLNSLGQYVFVEYATFASNTVNAISGMVMPLAMICVGGNLAFHGFDTKFKYVIISASVKLFIMPIMAVATALFFNFIGVTDFSGSDLTIIMILNALPMAVGAYVMQAELGGDSYIGASVLMLTMTFSAFTLTLFIFLFRVLGFLA
ncbi:MAG: AEC family transporter [Defluviitaleaceae bacterium]|nr:AEC family transporter [Defluviitaleaceae bacterium]